MIEIFGKVGCSFCRAAVKLAEDNDLDYVYYSIEDEGVYDEYIARFSHLPLKKFPQIMWDGEHIGGYTNMLEKVQRDIHEAGV